MRSYPGGGRSQTGICIRDIKSFILKDAGGQWLRLQHPTLTNRERATASPTSP